MAGSPTGRLVVGLRAQADWDLDAWFEADTLGDLVSASRSVRVLDLLPDIQHLPSRRLISDPGVILDIEGGLGDHGLLPSRTLTRYWYLDVRALERVAKTSLLRRIRDNPEFQWAYPQLEIVPAAVTDPKSNKLYEEGKQGYLEDAPVGISAAYAWKMGFDGNGVGFADMEESWDFDHEDLAESLQAMGYALVAGQIGYGKKHGTNAIGIVVAADNDKGIIGISPKLSRIAFISPFKKGTNSADDEDWLVAEAIAGLLASSGTFKGDVLLLEMQIQVRVDGAGGKSTYRCLPLEVVPHFRDAINLATANDIVVIEPAGNGSTEPYGGFCGHDLGQLTSAKYPWLDSEEVELADFFLAGEAFDLSPSEKTEAIMVGACHEAVVDGEHRAANLVDKIKENWGTNYGSRVDCYAWGENVWTTDTGDDHYTGDFGRTSAASAIIAGVAVLVQQMYREFNQGQTLSSNEMRDILGDPSLGTPGDPQRPIGVMPDLRLIYRHIACPDETGVMLFFCLIFSWLKRQMATMARWVKREPSFAAEPRPGLGPSGPASPA